MRICFLMGSADISGGSLVIFEHALFVAAQGHVVVMVTLEPFDAAKNRWHRATQVLRFTTLAAVAGEPFDLAVATWWDTVYHLPDIVARQYVYFVQSIESRFYPLQATQIRASVDATYQFGLPVITEARWVKTSLETQYGADVRLVTNGIDKAIFCATGAAISARQPERLRVLVEGKLGVPFKNVARTLRLMAQSDADEVWLLTPTCLTRYPGVDRVFSRLTIEATSTVYRACDVIVKLSYVEGMFGPPLEMFHCGGTAIVYDVTGADEYLVNGVNAVVCARDDEVGVIAAVNRLKHDLAFRARLGDGARTTAEAWPSWATSSAQFHAVIEDKAFLSCADAEGIRDTIRSARNGRRQGAADGRHTPRLPALARRGLLFLRRRAAQALRNSRVLNNGLSVWWALVTSRRPPV
jgi:O-antigen biosynthesis protein